MSIYAVIDFETTGLSPSHGARPTEIAVVLVEGQAIVDRYQSLMNPGVPIPQDIQVLTGITNAMVNQAPSVESVMGQAAAFAGRYPLVAHNAAFDRKFWEHSVPAAARGVDQVFICSLLLTRRLLPHAPNHRLSTLVRLLNLPDTGRYHRALADAEATAYLLMHLKQQLLQRYGLAVVQHELLQAIQKASRKKLEDCVQKYQQNQPGPSGQPQPRQSVGAKALERLLQEL